MAKKPKKTIEIFHGTPLDEATAARLKALAEKDRRSKAFLIREAITAYLERRDA